MRWWIWCWYFIFPHFLELSFFKHKMRDLNCTFHGWNARNLQQKEKTSADTDETGRFHVKRTVDMSFLLRERKQMSTVLFEWKYKQAGQDSLAGVIFLCSRFCVLTMNRILHNENKDICGFSIDKWLACSLLDREDPGSIPASSKCFFTWKQKCTWNESVLWREHFGGFNTSEK